MTLQDSLIINLSGRKQLMLATTEKLHPEVLLLVGHSKACPGIAKLASTCQGVSFVGMEAVYLH